MTRRGAALLAAIGLGVLCGAVAMPAVAALRLPLVSPAAQVAKREMALGDWRLRIETGKFSQDKIRHHHVTYASGALGFRFARGVNTLGAWVRIADGEPRRWRDDLPELIHLGVGVDGASIDNPTDGIVWVPARQLDEASAITIQPAPRKAPVTYHLHGFAGLRDIARDMGCAPDSRFAR